MSWKVYLLRCSDNSLYCGTTKDIDARVLKHNAGSGAKYTRSRRPVELVAVSGELSKRQAFQLESQIKKLPARKKIQAISLSNKS